MKTAKTPKKHNLEHVEKVYPTEDSHGNIEYWYCPECDKYFSDPDGEYEISQDETILPLFTFGYDDVYFKLISYNGNDENVIVPDKVPDDYPDKDLRDQTFSIIGDNAFKNNTTIKNVIIQGNIGNIGKSAFANCTNLTEVTIGDGLDYLSQSCFRNCPSLQKVTIYSEDNNFGMYYDAFSNSSNVTVYGYRNSKVHNVMDANHIPFVPLDPEEIEDETYSVSKTWDIDFANKDKPESIQVVLQRKISAKEWQTEKIVTLDDANSWQAEFEEVPSGYYDDTNERYVKYQYRIRELGPKKDGDDELDPNAEDFQKKVNERLIYDTWDFDRPVITQIINAAKNPEVIWQFEPNVDWVKKLAKTTAISPPFVMFEVGAYHDTVKSVPKHTTKYKASYAVDEEDQHKTNITNLAVLDTAVYKRWLNFNEGEKPDSVYLMLESKAQDGYLPAEENFYTPCASAVVGSLNVADIPISGETLRGLVSDGINATLGDNLFNMLTSTAIDAAINKYLATGIAVGKATPDSQNPLTRWRVKFTVKKYGMGEQKLPMDYAGAELVTGLMEMVIDALIHQSGLDISIPVMYEPFEKYWSIKGYALSLLHDYERTCNVINIKFHPGDSDPDDPDDPTEATEPTEPEDTLKVTKMWVNDEEADRPSYLKIHVYNAGSEITGSPIKLKKSDFSGSSTWTSGEIKLDQGVKKSSLTYTEEYPSKYENRDNYASTVFGSTIINRWLETNITGTKTWQDDNDKEGKRPEEITVNLMADGEKVDSVKVTAENGWKYSFVNQPIYKTENNEKVKIKYTVEVELKKEEVEGYSGNGFMPGVPTYLWTAEAMVLYGGKNPLVKAAMAVTRNEDDEQKNVSVYKNDIEWDLVKTLASDASNMTPNPLTNSLEVFATTKPYTFTFRYHFAKDGTTEDRGVVANVEYGKPVTFSSEFTDPEKYVHIEDTIPEENFCYWSADAEGLIPITTNRTFGMLMRGKWLDQSEADSTAMRFDERVAYRFEYGKPTDTTKPISNFNRVLYTLRSDTEKVENQQFSVIAYITVDGENYYFSEPNYDINIHELLSE